MLPIIICSVAAMAIIVERGWSLRRQRICPRQLVHQIWQWVKSGHLDVARISALRAGSPLGQVLAAGLMNREHSREVMKESIEEAGRHVVLELERFLNTLGSIAAVTHRVATPNARPRPRGGQRERTRGTRRTRAFGRSL